MSTRWPANSPISQLATGKPNALASVMVRYSFSTLSERSIPFCKRPIAGFRMWVVAVAPLGINHVSFHGAARSLRAPRQSKCENRRRCRSPSGLPARLPMMAPISFAVTLRPATAPAGPGSVILAQELQRADTIAADGRQEAEGVVASAPCFSEAVADRRVVRQQIVEHGEDGVADVRRRARATRSTPASRVPRRANPAHR